MWLSALNIVRVLPDHRQLHSNGSWTLIPALCSPFSSLHLEDISGRSQQMSRPQFSANPFLWKSDNIIHDDLHVSSGRYPPSNLECSSLWYLENIAHFRVFVFVCVIVFVFLFVFPVDFWKHRKNCECCPGQSLTDSQPSQSLSL